MKRKVVSADQDAGETLRQFLNEAQQDILSKADYFSQLLIRLRYEGKVSFGRNLREIKTTVRFFKNCFKQYVRLKENVIYPFLISHVPKFEPVIFLLLSECRDLGSKLKQLDVFSRQTAALQANSERLKQLGQLESAGLYFIFLLKHHLLSEAESIYKLAFEMLDPGELALLAAAVKEAQAPNFFIQHAIDLRKTR